ncbi:MAG: hypothetical protein AAF998_00425 [Bacteroidota bacterium]
MRDVAAFTPVCSREDFDFDPAAPARGRPDFGAFGQISSFAGVVGRGVKSAAPRICPDHPNPGEVTTSVFHLRISGRSKQLQWGRQRRLRAVRFKKL